MSFDLSKLPEPKPFTDAERGQRIVECTVLDQRVKSALGRTRAATWDLARALYEFHEAAAWMMVGFETVGDWLEDVGLPRREYERLVQGWRELAVRRGADASSMAHVDPSKAEIIVPALKAGIVGIAEAIGDASTMTQRELRAKYTPRPELPTPEAPPTPEIARVVDDERDDDASGSDLPGPEGDSESVEELPLRAGSNGTGTDCTPAAAVPVPDDASDADLDVLLERARSARRSHDAEAMRKALIGLAVTANRFALSTALHSLVVGIEAGMETTRWS